MNTSRFLQCAESDLFTIEAAARLVDLCHQCHVTDLLVQIHCYDGWIADTGYCTITSNRLNGMLPFDYLRQQADDIAVHPQVLIGTYEKWIGSLAHIRDRDLDLWNVKRVNSQLKDWLNFSLSDVREWLAEAMADLVFRNDISHLSLDYIRYEPEAVMTGEFSADDVTRTVNAIREAVPGDVDLIADVVPAYIKGDDIHDWHNVGAGQDWPEWLRDGLLSLAMPMNYIKGDMAEYLDRRYVNNPLVNDLLPITGAIMPFGYERARVSVEAWEQMVDAHLDRGWELSLFNSHLLFQEQGYIDVLNARPPSDIPEPPPDPEPPIGSTVYRVEIPGVLHAITVVVTEAS